MKKIPKHIILDYSQNPPEFVCINCNARRPLHIPAAIKVFVSKRHFWNDVVKQGEAFAESHKHCKPLK